jgi:hypothetical protein
MELLWCGMFDASSLWAAEVCLTGEITVRFQITANKMQRFLIYLFLQMIYMFQAVPLPIIRSTKLYIQLQVLSINTAAGYIFAFFVA